MERVFQRIQKQPDFLLLSMGIACYDALPLNLLLPGKRNVIRDILN